MKHLRQSCATIVLVLVLTGAASAEGIIHSGTPAPVPPPPPAADGIIHSGFVQPGEELNSEEKAADSATEIALSLIQNLLALF